MEVRLRKGLMRRFIAVYAREDAETVTVYWLSTHGDARPMVVRREDIVRISPFDVERGAFVGDE